MWRLRKIRIEQPPKLQKCKMESSGQSVRLIVVSDILTLTTGTLQKWWQANRRAATRISGDRLCLQHIENQTRKMRI